jgi:hypothetical protein
LRFCLGPFQFAETHDRLARRHPRQALAHEHAVYERAVLEQHVLQMPVVGVERFAIRFETNPSAKDERGQSIASFEREGRRRIEPAPDFRRVDAEQPDTAERRDVDSVAVDHRADEKRVRARRHERRPGVKN